jgi:parallel beta-helix repeat protein
MACQRSPMNHSARYLLFLRLAAITVWFALLPLSASSQAYHGPLSVDDGNYASVTKNGVLTGDWQSTDPSIPAVRIKTRRPVTILHSHLRGPGDLIECVGTLGASLSVRDCVGIGVNPNQVGKSKGDFVHAEAMSKLVVENCDIRGMRFGVYIDGYDGSRTGDQTITIRGNRGRNMDGRRSDGKGGWQPSQKDRDWSHFVQLNHVQAVPGIEIAWNEVVDAPFQSSVDDVINIYQSSGTVSSPLRIHDNFIDGAYPNSPKTDTYSGGGIITDGGTDTKDTATAFVDIDDNQVIDTTNYGIAISNGHDNVIKENRVLSTGLLPDGSTVAAQNVGVYISDIYGHNVANGSMYDDHASENTVGWVNKSPRLASNGYRNDEYFSIPGTASDYKRNTPWAHTPTQVDVRNEWARWRTKVRQARLTIGPD